MRTYRDIGLVNARQDRDLLQLTRFWFCTLNGNPVFSAKFLRNFAVL